MVARSDIGRVRTGNEDSVFIDQSLGLALLADGMGGYNAGEVASHMATSQLAESLAVILREVAEFGECTASEVPPLKLADRLAREIAKVNEAILDASFQRTEYSGMGTTLVAAIFRGDLLTLAHIGDSRCYRWRDGALDLLTRDHSVLQEQLDNGIISRSAAMRVQGKSLLTRALGVDPVVEPDISEFSLLPGDVYLVCSDGLSDLVDESGLANELRDAYADPEASVSRLVALANQLGGRDNITGVVVTVGQRPPVSKASWWRRLVARYW